MNTSNLKTATQFKALALIIDTMERQGYTIDEYCEAGYNDSSGYIYIYSEDLHVSFGITDFAFNRGEYVECILWEQETGVEFFGRNAEDVEAQYKVWAAEMVLNGDLHEDDVMQF